MQPNLLIALMIVTLPAATALAAEPSTRPATRPTTVPTHYTLDYDTPIDPGLQTAVESIDADLRADLGMTTEQSAVGLLDLRTGRVAMVHPDRVEYAASVPKVAILLAWFDRHPDPADLDDATRRELGLMIKRSSNEMAAKYSRLLGLREIQAVVEKYGLYDAARGGGIWVGKHYGAGDERHPDPVGGHSHAATVRQLLRYYLMLEQGELVSPGASAAMREIFASPGVEPLDAKFVKGLAGRGLTVLRKSGTYEDWAHDSAVVAGPGRRYVLVALTRSPAGEAYLERLAPAVDDVMRPRAD